MQWGGTKYPWNSGTVIGLFVGGGVLFIIFVAWEWYVGETALIPGVIMGRRQVAVACLFAFLQLGSLAVMSYYLPLCFQAVQGVSPLNSGVRVLPSVLPQILALGIVGTLANRMAYYNPWFFVGSAMMCTAAGLYTTFKAFHTSMGQWVGFQVLQGLGVDLTMQVPTLVLQQDPEKSPLMSIGVSMGLFSQYFGASVEQVIAGSIFNTYLKKRLRDISLGDCQIGFLLTSGTAHVRQTAEQNFPDLIDPILEAYNYAFARVYVSFPRPPWRPFCYSVLIGTFVTHCIFTNDSCPRQFVPVVACSIAFAVAMGLEWRRIVLDKVTGVNDATVDQQLPGNDEKSQRQQDERQMLQE
ncbi:MFS transporter [Apiospora saccharicola]|uniref:MFS transporter n=1 Tax=Apiospora saccharicola TaxID=335842 RepID=A0ABR1TJZ3_9PEZI